MLETARRRTDRWIAALIVLTFASAIPAEAAPADLEGIWTASRAEREGERADELVGHRLAFSGNRFQIDSPDGKPLYAGTFQINPSSEPASIDFEHSRGVLSGKVWKGIYQLNRETLTICDNAANLEKGRPTAFEAKAGSGSVLLTFRCAMP